mmetsp:Transcript_10373/g.39235  ORF Transcript_10373/g.39235 Transcript_10373/m.39235 type:complete len:266 (-) Transcript_10373:325-1122(-)
MEDLGVCTAAVRFVQLLIGQPRNDAAGVQRDEPFVVRRDRVRDVDGVPREGLVHVLHPAARVGEVLYPLVAALKDGRVCAVVANDGREQPDVGLGDLVAKQEPRLAEAGLNPVQGLGHVLCGLFVRLLGRREAAAVDPVVQAEVEQRRPLIQLALQLRRTQLDLPGLPAPVYESAYVQAIHKLHEVVALVGDRLLALRIHAKGRGAAAHEARLQLVVHAAKVLLAEERIWPVFRESPASSRSLDRIVLQGDHLDDGVGHSPSRQR